MGTEEKKFKIDELPDHLGGELDKLAPAPKSITKPALDQRMNKSKNSIMNSS